MHFHVQEISGGTSEARRFCRVPPAVLSRAHIQMILKGSDPSAGAAQWMHWDLIKGGFVAHCLLVVPPSSSYLPNGLVCASLSRCCSARVSFCVHPCICFKAAMFI